MDKIDTLTLSTENKTEFIDKLTGGLLEFFETDSVDNFHENYGYQLPWSLLSLIRDDKIDTYTLVYVNGRIWGGSGGMIRDMDGKKVYQGGFRWFSNAKNHVSGLGYMKTYIHTHTMTDQFIRAREQNCEQYILSFNTYNDRFFKISKNYHLRKAFPDIEFKPSNGHVMFNGVMQQILIVDLK